MAPNAPAEEKAAKKKRAEEALAAVKKKGAKFETLAAEFGEDPTKDRGGDLGFFQKGRMVKPFEDAVWGMKVGQITGPIETQFGFHVIKKMEVKAARKPKFAVRAYTRCQRCGRPKAVYRKFGLCRICLREMAHRGELPGIPKSSW